MMLPIPVWCFVLGPFALIGAISGVINNESIWAIAGCVIMGASGAFLCFLGIKELRYQNGKAEACSTHWPHRNRSDKHRKSNTAARDRNTNELAAKVMNRKKLQ